jgi:hypothetical protein
MLATMRRANEMTGRISEILKNDLGAYSKSEAGSKKAEVGSGIAETPQR